MEYRIEDIDGVGPVLRKRLEMVGIETTQQLLEACGSPRGRRETSEATGVSEAVLLRWANIADLMRIHGIGKQFSELLEASGVDTVKELKTRDAESLAIKMKEVNRNRRFARTLPSVERVFDWVEKAKKLNPIITH